MAKTGVFSVGGCLIQQITREKYARKGVGWALYVLKSNTA